MELEGSYGDEVDSTVHEGADGGDESATSVNSARGSRTDVSASEAKAAAQPIHHQSRGSGEGAAAAAHSPVALAERLRTAAEARRREIAKLREDTAALREEIAQLREEPGSMIEELNEVRAALSAAMDELRPSGRIPRASRDAREPSEPDSLENVDEDEDEDFPSLPPEPDRFDPKATRFDPETNRFDPFGEGGDLPFSPPRPRETRTRSALDSWDEESGNWGEESPSWDESEPPPASGRMDEETLEDAADADPPEDRGGRLFRLRKRH